MKDRKSETIEKLVSHFLDFYCPNYLSLEDISHSTSKLSNPNIQVINNIEKIARNKGIKVRISSWEIAKTHLGLSKQDNIDIVVKKIAGQVPILSNVAPSKRKAWESSKPILALFKAYALTTTLLQ